MIEDIARQIREKIPGHHPQTAIILGSGLGSLGDAINNAVHIDYREISGFPQSTVSGHRGKLIIGNLEGAEVICLQGRFHLYEGHPPQVINTVIKTLWELGIRRLIVTNAAGSLTPDFQPGTIMLIKDHINLSGSNPLIGPNLAELGPRFPDMHNCYDRELIAAATRIAEEEGIKLQYGVYVGGTGPTFETQAEYRYFKAIGGDAAGMSTVPEVIVARHMSIPVFGVSVITNCGLSDEVGDHEDVQRQGRKAGAKMQTLFIRMIENLK